MTRLFAALPLPEALREQLAEVGARIARTFPGARTVAPENLHLTLRFFGSVVHPERLAAGLGPRFRALCPPVLEPAEFSAFPSLRRARLAWAGFAEAAGTEGRLAALRGAAESVALSAGLEPDSRPFVAHATLLRFRAPTRIAASELPGAQGELFAVPEAVLFESALTPRGAVYREVERYALEPVSRNSARRSGPRRA